MQKLLITITLSLFLLSCKKEENSIPEFSEAAYKITVTGLWKSPEFGVPPSVHFTNFVGMVHNQNSFLWKSGSLASIGVENIAEIGVSSVLFAEVDSAINLKMALAPISIPAPAPTGSANRTIYCNSNYSYFSFISMLAPSPDWFVGINGFNLYNNKQWISDTTILLYAYDAGTEDGDVFGYGNPPTVPQENIQLLTTSKGMTLANGNPSLGPIATVRITRQ